MQAYLIFTSHEESGFSNEIAPSPEEALSVIRKSADGKLLLDPEKSLLDDIRNLTAGRTIHADMVGGAWLAVSLVSFDPKLKVEVKGKKVPIKGKSLYKDTHIDVHYLREGK